MSTSHATLIRLANLVFNGILLMQERPEMVEAEAIVEKGHKTKKKGRTPDIWSPKWVGRNYRIKRESPGTGTHASPRFHWRDGHWRDQPVGEGRKEIRRIWIESMMVNVHLDDDGQEAK